MNHEKEIESALTMLFAGLACNGLSASPDTIIEEIPSTAFDIAERMMQEAEKRGLLKGLISGEF